MTRDTERFHHHKIKVEPKIVYITFSIPIDHHIYICVYILPNALGLRFGPYID